jgi:NADPH-dependent 2,4-dienoyl-CoA reductase/sulfur reductase-like enzyme
MSAALMLAERGATVTLVERQEQVGGQFLWAAKVNFKQPFAKVVDLCRRRLEGLGVKFIRREATADWVMEQKAHYTILATGSLPFEPPMPGLGLIPHRTFGEALEEGVQGSRVLILGGGATGCEIAELLLSQGRQVILVEMLEQLAGDMGNARPLLLERLRKMGLEAHTKTLIQEIQKDKILLQQDGKTLCLEEIECLILACGVVPNNKLERELRQAGVEVLTVGDCQKPQNGFWAIRAGFELGMTLGSKRTG